MKINFKISHTHTTYALQMHSNIRVFTLVVKSCRKPNCCLNGMNGLSLFAMTCAHLDNIVGMYGKSSGWIILSRCPPSPLPLSTHRSRLGLLARTAYVYSDNIVQNMYGVAILPNPKILVFHTHRHTASTV